MKYNRNQEKINKQTGSVEILIKSVCRNTNKIDKLLKVIAMKIKKEKNIK